MQSVLFFGLGRIGLPQSLVFAKAGFKTFGYDSDKSVIESLKNSKLPFNEPGMEEIFIDCKNKFFFPIDSWHEILSEIDAIFFTLGTSAPNFESCLSADSGEIDNIEKILISLLANKLRKKEILFVFRTTLFLGSMDRLKANIESKTNMIEGVDFHMSFVPERLMEGDAINEEQSLPKIIGAFNDHGYELTKKLFESIGSGLIIRVSNPRSAEFCKLSDNSYRNTNFAFSNDLAIWAAANGVDVHEVIKTINVGYDRNNIPKPGFVSGYCLGKDPYIFEYGFNKKVKDRTFQSLWYYGRRTNDFLIDYVSKKVFNQANIHKKNISHLNIAVLGLSFKEDIDDFRMSHSFDLIESLIANGASKIIGYDPNLSGSKYTKIPEHLINSINLWTNELNPKDFIGVDIVIIAHRHNNLTYMNQASIESLFQFANKPLIIFDAWNIWRVANNIKDVKYLALGFEGDNTGG